MSEEWPDIPGVTEAQGRPRLPRHPQVVVRTLVAALDGGLTLPELVDRAWRDTNDDRERLEGLAGWLPLSRVAWWDEGSGRLGFDASTNLEDLAVRYAAWIGAQPVAPEHAERLETYIRGIVTVARGAGPRAPRTTGPPRPAPAAQAEPPAPTRAPLVPTELTERLRTLLHALDASFLERRVHLRATLLALLSGQHVLLLGPPGTAKSMLARAMCGAFEDARYFEYLLSRFTHPDELFGPVSIPGLKDEDYRRLTEGFLPQAHIAFLDEIFKANSAILNSLLTLVNERVFHHGRHRDPVPLLGLVGASNELPEPDAGLGALYDRFLVRLAVPPLGARESFLAVATGAVEPVRIPEHARLRTSDLRTLADAAPQVEIPPPVADALAGLWEVGARREWEVSDRRWRQAVQMLRIGVAADGRRAMSPLDLLLLEPVLAPTPDRCSEVREAILERIGTGAVPQHDLRAQWTLLRADRVAPVPDAPAPADLPPDAPWSERLVQRRRSVERFLVHHRHAVDRLARDRARLEQQGERHLWLSQLPVEVLARHIEAARDLVRILRIAEAYAEDVGSPVRAARALLRSLPASRRVYGSRPVVALRVTDGGFSVGLTLAGERAEATDLKLARLELSAAELLEWVDGARPLSSFRPDLPAWSGREVVTALSATQRLLGGSAVPRPPELPQP